MSLEKQTIEFINASVRSFYKKAIDHGATVSEVTPIDGNLYVLKLGNAELTYMGTADGTARPVGISGEIFE